MPVVAGSVVVVVVGSVVVVVVVGSVVVVVPVPPVVPLQVPPPRFPPREVPPPGIVTGGELGPCPPDDPPVECLVPVWRVAVFWDPLCWVPTAEVDEVDFVAERAPATGATGAPRLGWGALMVQEAVWIDPDAEPDPAFPAEQPTWVTPARPRAVGVGATAADPPVPGAVGGVAGGPMSTPTLPRMPSTARLAGPGRTEAAARLVVATSMVATVVTAMAAGVRRRRRFEFGHDETAAWKAVRAASSPRQLVLLHGSRRPRPGDRPDDRSSGWAWPRRCRRHRGHPGSSGPRSSGPHAWSRCSPVMVAVDADADQLAILDRCRLLIGHQALLESTQSAVTEHPYRSRRPVHDLGDPGHVHPGHDPEHDGLGLVVREFGDEGDRPVGGRVLGRLLLDVVGTGHDHQARVLDEVGPPLAVAVPVGESVAGRGEEPSPEALLVAGEGRQGTQDARARCPQPGPRPRVTP